MDEGHDAVDGGAHVVCREAADEGVEVGGGGTDAEEEGDFDEDEDEGAYAVWRLVGVAHHRMCRGR